MTETLLVAGTASHVGKSTVAAGLCRTLSNRDVSVAPYKAQNMSNNAQVVVTPDGDWGEIGVSQYTQARAACVTPTTDMNPVLLKPRGEGESQLVVQGHPVEHVRAGEYYDRHWERARKAAVESYERLAAEYDVIIAEGAGSIAEINLHDRDLANLETARFADASILLLVDIERGGAFASLYGTLELLPNDIRERVVGAVITKFRGDASLLEAGIDEIESRTGTPFLGVLPHDDPGLPAEDSVSLPSPGETSVIGDDDGIPDECAVTVVVPHLPHISNFTDLEPLANEPGVRVRYVPLDSSLDGVDAVVLPGTKNTVDDLRALKHVEFNRRLHRFDGVVVGLCGGYQMLGETITNAQIESTGEQASIDGVGLLPIKTDFTTEKHLERVSVSVEGSGPITGATGTAEGYEIHMGRTAEIVLDEDSRTVSRPLGERSIATDRVLGTYLHGLFENQNIRHAFIERLFEHRNMARPSREQSLTSPYERAASLVNTGRCTDLVSHVCSLNVQ